MGKRGKGRTQLGVLSSRNFSLPDVQLVQPRGGMCMEGVVLVIFQIVILEPLPYIIYRLLIVQIRSNGTIMVNAAI